MKDQEQKQDSPQGDNLAFWKTWEHVAPGMLKEIKGGNLNGKSDINPVWRFKELTEAFGPCGFGWTVREVERWKDEAAGEISVNVKVHLLVRICGEWSEPIEGVGGSKLCGKGRGDGINDEAWKMATTDAISVACKAIGMAADVYTGRQSHKDPDQQKTGGDYGSKYDARNYGHNSTRNSQVGNYTTQEQRAQNSPVPAPATGAQAPAPADPGDVRIPEGVTESDYWGIIRAYGDGYPTKSGGDYRETFIAMYQPTPDQVAKFDRDVENYRIAKNGGAAL